LAGAWWPAKQSHHQKMAACRLSSGSHVSPRSHSRFLIRERKEHCFPCFRQGIRVGNQMPNPVFQRNRRKRQEKMRLLELTSGALTNHANASLASLTCTSATDWAVILSSFFVSCAALSYIFSVQKKKENWQLVGLPKFPASRRNEGLTVDAVVKRGLPSFHSRLAHRPASQANQYLLTT